MTQEELEALRLAEEAEAQRLAEEAEAQRLAQETEATNPMMQTLIGQQGQQETGDTNPLLTAGLGLGSGFVASQTGGTPATSQVLSSFAQKVAAQDAANLAAQRAAFNPAIIGQNLPKVVNPAVKGRVKPDVFNRPNIKSTTPLTPNKITGGLNANPFSNIASNLLKGSVLTMAATPNLIGDSSVRGAYDRAVDAGEDPAAAAARLGTKDTSIRGLDPSNREVDFMPDGTGVLNGVSLFTGDAASTGSNYADLVNADRAQSELLSRPSPEEDTFVEPLDFAGEIQNNPEPYSGLVDNNPFTSLGGTPVEENPYTVAREAGEPSPNALLDLAEREGALGPKLTDIFQGRAEALSAPTENPIDATDPGPVAAPGSPQAIFEEAKKLGLGDRDIAEFEKSAARMGTTFDPVYGFSRDPLLQAQADKEYLSNRDGYGYAGAANDQYQSADFDTISQGVFDTPMTGMRPVNSETGEPLSQGVIDAAARAGLELPMGSVPLPKAPVNSVPMGRDATRAALGGMTLNQYLNAADGAVSGLRTDPQGRMIPARERAAQDGIFAYDNMTRADAYGDYEERVAEANQRQSDSMRQAGESQAQRDTRNAASRTTGSGNVPRDVRQALDTPANMRTSRQQERASQWEGSSQGKQMGGAAGYAEMNRTPEQKETARLQTEYTQARVEELKKVDPDTYDTAANTVDKFIADGGAGDRTKLIQQLLFPNQSNALGTFMGQDGGFPNTVEGKIDFAMTKNPGKTRAEVAAEMRAKGIIQ